MKLKGISEKLMRHTRKPEGSWGKLVGEIMGKAHVKVTEWGLTKVNIKSHEIILEIGCGAGYNINNLAKNIINGKIFGIDYSEAMVDLANEINKEYIQTGLVDIKYANVSSLPFKDNMFDLVLGIETVNFWPEIINDLKEIYRVIKPNGRLLLINNSYKHKAFKKRNAQWKTLTDFSLYKPQKFRKFFVKAGFIKIEVFEVVEKNWIAVLGFK